MTPAPASQPSFRFEADRCANCFNPLPQDDKHRPVLFCSDLCRDYAAVIRYWRKALRTGSLAEDPGVREALGMRIAHLLAGGYNARARRIPDVTRALVIKRDKVCVSCGAPGEEIDHIDGDSSEPGNLQYLCMDCHQAKTRSHMVPASAEQNSFIDALEAARVQPNGPAQLCDDETFWVAIERILRKERTNRLRDTLFTIDSSASLITEIKGMAAARPDAGDYEADDHAARGEDDDSGYGPDSYYARAMAKDD